MSASNNMSNDQVDDQKKDTSEKEQSASVKKYACFVAGEPPTKELIKNYGDYGDMLINFLKEDEKNEEWLRFDVRKDEFPTESQLKEISGIAITGSASDAHSNEPWVGLSNTTI
ncbi:glutamine amidotransferase class-I [Reticulomyxa filosa]|uniref:Glutamine amidotransferase class-I n=1 Tax=Reticulomyxa filosa TaxID=46433 RepID=X6MDS3_RETFI|nr:glutamine amidotransferase class-I [Reticulomyxa filosa]|eukprot:ETO12168.1 glutamine amidotransferase class-I [Reticulomyxa filosa]